MAVNRIPRIILDGDRESSSYMAREGIRQLGILKDLMGFSSLRQDIRRVEYIDGSRIVCRSCFGEDVVYIYTEKKEEPEGEERFYIYITISDYVTIWDSYTGEVAEGVCNNEGETYDEAGNSLTTFPCHKDELVRWLEGIKDRPTRQVLKDDPEDRKDYVANNKKDIGNESRVEKASIFDPSYGCYYGVTEPAGFTNIVRDEIFDDCSPGYCDMPVFTEPCFIPNLEECTVGEILEKDTLHPSCIKGDCDPEKYEESFQCNFVKSHFYDCFFFYNTAYRWRKQRDCYRRCAVDNEMKYLQTYFLKTKHLYLCSYPSPHYSPPGTEAEIDYCLPEYSSYINPLDMETACTRYSCSSELHRGPSPVPPYLDLRTISSVGKSISVKTELGDLLLDYVPRREWEEDREMLYEAMRNAVVGDRCFYEHVREGSCDSIEEFEQVGSYWETGSDRPEHAGYDIAWCRDEETVAIPDVLVSESNRTAVSWCGSPTPKDQLDEDGEVIKEAVTDGWYRVLLRFYMGGFHTTGHEANWNKIIAPCPTQAECDAVPAGFCEVTEWENELSGERFSSVQATIELERPKEYARKRSATCEHCINGGCAEYLRYKRPDGYAGHEEDFTLCAFPDRTQGCEEDLENDVCYPFDGTYDIFTLGKAVEELINNHYIDGSDDPLLVYLYKRDT